MALRMERELVVRGAELHVQLSRVDDAVTQMLIDPSQATSNQTVRRMAYSMEFRVSFLHLL